MNTALSIYVEASLNLLEVNPSCGFTVSLLTSTNYQYFINYVKLTIRLQASFSLLSILLVII